MNWISYIKKYASVSLILLFAVVCAAGCAKAEVPVGEEARIRITASFYPLYIMLLNITDGVDGVQLDMLAPPDTGCLHDYQLTVADMKKIESASVLVLNGAGMENFLDAALEQKKDSAIVAAEGYVLIDGNPHVWVSFDGALYEIDRIAQGLARADPPYAELYLENAQVYAEKIRAVSKRMHAVLDQYAGAPIITFHEAFPYFAAEFNFNITGVIEREPGTAPSPRELTVIIEDILAARQAPRQDAAAPALFAEPGYASAAAEIIARETGLPVYELDPAVSGPLEKDAYIDAMECNLEVLQYAFSHAGP